jgi:hypothetical protein
MWAMDVATPASEWPDVEGASLIGTLRKMWVDDTPWKLAIVLLKITVRKVEVGAELPAAVESCMLGFVHLLPGLVRCCAMSHLMLHTATQPTSGP